MARMTGLRPALTARRLSGRFPLNRRRVRRGRARGVPRILIEPFFQLGDLRLQSPNAALVPLYQHPECWLDIGGNPVPQLLRQGRLSPHDACSHISALEFTQVQGVNGYLVLYGVRIKI